MSDAITKCGFISDIRLRGYFGPGQSLFRRYQNTFLERYGPELDGHVVELGGEKHYNHRRFFPNATEYTCTNIARDYDEYADITALPYPNDSQDAFVCVSVLEHVYDVHKAVKEVHRALKIGGRLLATIPFAYPFHDEQDYWRFSVSAYQTLFSGFDILAFVHLGGRISTIVDILRRPRGRLSKRYIAYKMLGFTIGLLCRRLDTLDGFPLGYGIYAAKQPPDA